MKLKIISDGTAKGTKVYHKDTGEEIKNITAVDITINPWKYKAEVTMFIDEFEFIGEKNEVEQLSKN